MVMIERDQHFRKNIKIILLNICSIRSKLDEMKTLCLTEKPDLLILTEIWINSDETRQGGGCVMYIRKGVHFKLIKNHIDINTIILEIHMKHQANLNIIATYRPPKQENCLEFTAFLEEVLSNYRNTVCFGDININLLDQNSDNCSKYMELLTSLGYIIYNKIDHNSATRKTPTSSTSRIYYYSNCIIFRPQLAYSRIRCTCQN